MSALDWHKQMSGAPRLSHTDGMVVVLLEGRTIVFPSDAAARFFFEAFADVPNLAAQVDILRAQIDEAALNTALARVKALEAENAQLHADKAALEATVVAEVARRTDAVKRATLLARTLRAVREKL